MVNKALVMIIFLLLLSAGILFFQWNGYENKIKGSEMPVLQQTISIEQENHQLIINQTFQGFKEMKKVMAKSPAEAFQIQCFSKEGKCNVEGQTLELIPKGESITIQYKMNHVRSKPSLLLTDWFIRVDQAKVKATTIKLTEKAERSGEWFSSLPRVGEETLNLVDYYVFAGKGESPILYWQSEDANQVLDEPGLIVYGNDLDKIKMDHSYFSKDSYQFAQPIIIVITPLHSEYKSEYFMLLNDSSGLSHIPEKMMKDYVDKRFQFPEKEKWYSDFLVSILLNQPVGTNKAKEMYAHFVSSIPKEKIHDWKRKVRAQEGHEIDGNQLDDLLNEVMGWNTNFFEENANPTTPLKKITFFDPRPVFVNGKRQDNIQLMLEKNRLVFPFEITLKAMGFDITAIDENNQYVIKKDRNLYRFYLNKNHFMLNEEDYGLLKNPLEQINGKIYMEKIWLEEIFDATITDKKHSIEIRL
ncbi:hypothetical protein J2S13_001618 [Oikeobacillus pervagus]|uniref:Copper amine oxidase-like N-terminal domain-containing protein n=1 Tax=Oikeobacillus pervagus TaxID=1325931 RepID=A0AAJ1WJA3_9BACI|nr:stalk domain-containing protein [Oikeobacillus pervagus]MDQ0215218.1 hypothetical protein [Oikeobacillus pervagus]